MDSNLDMSKLSDADKRELQQVLMAESQKNTIQQTVHSLTQTCFKKCITSIKSAELDSKEEACQENCVNRFMDSQFTILKQLESMRGQA